MTGAMLLRHEPASAAEMRRELGTDLDQHGIGAEVIDSALLVASELVGNAVRHGSCTDDAPLGVSWDVLPCEIVISVSDANPGLPVVKHPQPTETHGRGMAIVAGLALRWGVEPTHGGKRVWAALSR